MNYSKQRELILKTLQENSIHPTAEALCSLAREKDPTLSLATVYRNLNLLADKGIIRRLIGLDNFTHFDFNTHKHYHFVCTKCNKVYDVAYEIAPALAEKLAEQTGLIAESCDISFKGICHKCRSLT